jgi:hypothetical protein
MPPHLPERHLPAQLPGNRPTPFPLQPPRPFYRRPALWILLTVGLVFGAGFTIVYREFFVTKTWDGHMTFQVTWVGPSSMSVTSIARTADSPPITAYIDADIPVSIGSKVGDHLMCTVSQTFLPNTDIDQGPHSKILDCTPV